LVTTANSLDAVIRISGLLSSSSEQTKSDLKKRGVTMVDGKLSVKTDRPAPSRDEYIASTQRAFERGAKTIGAHPEAFKTGQNAEASGSSSAVPTPSVHCPNQIAARPADKSARGKVSKEERSSLRSI
jgi:hypothetical protein